MATVWPKTVVAENNLNHYRPSCGRISIGYRYTDARMALSACPHRPPCDGCPRFGAPGIAQGGTRYAAGSWRAAMVCPMCPSIPGLVRVSPPRAPGDSRSARVAENRTVRSRQPPCRAYSELPRAPPADQCSGRHRARRARGRARSPVTPIGRIWVWPGICRWWSSGDPARRRSSWWRIRTALNRWRSALNSFASGWDRACTACG